jgi:hypothetical protein
LFDTGPVLPAGFRYEQAFLSPEEERDIVGRVEALPFK